MYMPNWTGGLATRDPCVTAKRGPAHTLKISRLGPPMMSEDGGARAVSEVAQRVGTTTLGQLFGFGCPSLAQYGVGTEAATIGVGL